MRSARGRPRVVSLVPSITETLLSWGIAPVAVTRFCDAPGTQEVGGTKNPHIEAIAGLQPDLVIMDREENRLEDAEALTSAGIQVHATHVLSVGDVVPALREIAELVGAQARVPEDDFGAPPEIFSRAWIPIWRRPWMTFSGRTYASSLLALAGIENIFASEPLAYPQLELDAATARAPDIVLAPSEPYPFSQRHRAELEQVAPVVFVDGRDLFWWGSRTPEAVYRLRALAAGLASR